MHALLMALRKCSKSSFRCFMFFQVRCGKCGNGLGHEFINDGPAKGLSRFRIFSDSLKFVPKGKTGLIISHNLLFWHQFCTCANFTTGLPNMYTQTERSARPVYQIIERYCRCMKAYLHIYWLTRNCSKCQRYDHILVTSLKEINQDEY